MKNPWDAYCQNLLLQARNESQRMEHFFLGTEHIALALIDEPDSLLNQVLATLGVRKAEVRQAILDEITPSTVIRGKGFALAPRMRAIVRHAEQMASKQNCAEINDSHLLAALIAGGRGVFLRVLEDFGVLPDALLTALDEHVSARPPILTHAPPVATPPGAPGEEAPSRGLHSTLEVADPNALGASQQGAAGAGELDPSEAATRSGRAMPSLREASLSLPGDPATKDKLQAINLKLDTGTLHTPRGMTQANLDDPAEANTLPGRRAQSGGQGPAPSNSSAGGPASPSRDGSAPGRSGPSAPPASRPGETSPSGTRPGLSSAGPDFRSHTVAVGASPTHLASTAARSGESSVPSSQAGSAARPLAGSPSSPPGLPTTGSGVPPAAARQNPTVDALAPHQHDTLSDAPAFPQNLVADTDIHRGKRITAEPIKIMPTVSSRQALAPGQPLYNMHPMFYAQTNPQRKTVFGISQLDDIGRDLTALARAGKLGPIVGRDAEIEAVGRLLCRERRGNALLVGDTGVGKTAIIEALAIDIVLGRVPAALKNVRLLEISATALANALEGRDLEARTVGLFQEASLSKTILVIDDLHALYGSHGKEHQALCNLMARCLTSGKVRVIGTTHPGGLGQLEQLPILDRQFEAVRIGDPDEVTAVEVLRLARLRLGAFHQVQITDDAVLEAYRLSKDFLGHIRQPQSGVDLLDQACTLCLGVLASSNLAMRGTEPPAPVVDAAMVARALGLQTGMAPQELTSAQKTHLGEMETQLRRSVVGQEDAIHVVAERVRMVRAGFREEGRPQGVFLFLGPTGVGKTELAKAVAACMYPAAADDRLLRLDMSEFKNEADASRLVGAAPGYLGHDRDALLTSHFRKAEHFVLLLDEIEKAHPSILDLFLQVLDAGRLTDSHGKVLDFRHVVVVMTSNLGGRLWQWSALNHSLSPDDPVLAQGERPAQRPEVPKSLVHDELKDHLRLEFINRIDEVVLFRPLGRKEIHTIARQMLKRWQQRSERQGYAFTVDDDLLDLLVDTGLDEELGARPMKRAIEQYIIAPMSRFILSGELVRNKAIRVRRKGQEAAFEQEDSTS